MKIISILIIIFIFTGCSDRLVLVMPYEKEYFANDKMKFDPIDIRSEQDGHVFLIREASAGAQSSFQGGCGCR